MDILIRMVALMKKRLRKNNKHLNAKVTPIYQELPTKEKMRKTPLEFEVLETKISRARVLNQNLIDTYLLKNLINQSQYDAGFKYYVLWRKSGLEKQLTIKYDITLTNNNSVNLGSLQGDAYIELNKARKAIGNRLCTVLDNVCLYNNPLSTWEKEYNVKAKTGMTALILALDSLCDYWGLT